MELSAKQPFPLDEQVTAAKIAQYIEPAQPDTPSTEILARFLRNPQLSAIPVVAQARPVGLISRHILIDRLATQGLQLELDGETCSDLMDTHPLRVEASTPIQELGMFLGESSLADFIDSFIITEQGQYIGTGTTQDILRQLAQSQFAATRHANPLTTLPGSVPTHQHIASLVQSGKTFVVCCANLDNFKAYNNRYGHLKGNDAICYIGDLLKRNCDVASDFIGHSGGDNFILAMQGDEWKARCNKILTDFAQTSLALFKKTHQPTSVGNSYITEDRQGRVLHHAPPALSIGAVEIFPGVFRSHYEIMDAVTAALAMAKKKPGNNLFVERRLQHAYRSSDSLLQNTEVHYG